MALVQYASTVLVWFHGQISEWLSVKTFAAFEAAWQIRYQTTAGRAKRIVPLSAPLGLRGRRCRLGAWVKDSGSAVSGAREGFPPRLLKMPVEDVFGGLAAKIDALVANQ